MITFQPLGSWIIPIKSWTIGNEFKVWNFFEFKCPTILVKLFLFYFKLILVYFREIRACFPNKRALILFLSATFFVLSFFFFHFHFQSSSRFDASNVYQTSSVHEEISLRAVEINKRVLQQILNIFFLSLIYSRKSTLMKREKSLLEKKKSFLFKGV